MYGQQHNALLTLLLCQIQTCMPTDDWTVVDLVQAEMEQMTKGLMKAVLGLVAPEAADLASENDLVCSNKPVTNNIQQCNRPYWLLLGQSTLWAIPSTCIIKGKSANPGLLLTHTTANPGLAGKLQLKRCVCVCVLMSAIAFCLSACFIELTQVKFGPQVKVFQKKIEQFAM